MLRVSNAWLLLIENGSTEHDDDWFGSRHVFYAFLNFDDGAVDNVAARDEMVDLRGHDGRCGKGTIADEDFVLGCAGLVFFDDFFGS